MCTSTFEKGGEIIVVTGITQIIAGNDVDIDMLENNHNENSKVVDNDSNCLRDTSDSKELSSFFKGTSTYGDSKVFFNGLT